MAHAESLENALSLTVPDDPDLALVLLMLRKMASGDLHDTELAELAYQAFGREYERPLTLIRAYMIEAASASQRRIRIVRQSCNRMTNDEGRMLDALVLATRDRDSAEVELRELCDSSEVVAPLAAAQLLAGALIDLGCPLGAR